LEAKLPPTSSRHKALDLENRCIGRTIYGDMDFPKQWQHGFINIGNPISKETSPVFCGRGFYAFLFETKEY
jgi:hypothetical protein